MINYHTHRCTELFLRQNISSELPGSFYKLQIPGPHSSETYWIGSPGDRSQGYVFSKISIVNSD
jgi:hypothetical protein